MAGCDALACVTFSWSAVWVPLREAEIEDTERNADILRQARSKPAGCYIVCSKSCVGFRPGQELQNATGKLDEVGTTSSHVKSCIDL